jgi:hypothetical protein
LAYSFSEKFLKKLVGRKDIEDALQRLEKSDRWRKLKWQLQRP